MAESNLQEMLAAALQEQGSFEANKKAGAEKAKAEAEALRESEKMQKKERTGKGKNKREGAIAKEKAEAGKMKEAEIVLQQALKKIEEIKKAGQEISPALENILKQLEKVHTESKSSVAAAFAEVKDAENEPEVMEAVREEAEEEYEKKLTLEELVKHKVEREFERLGFDKLTFSPETRNADWGKVLEFWGGAALARTLEIYNLKEMVETYELPEGADKALSVGALSDLEIGIKEKKFPYSKKRPEVQYIPQGHDYARVLFPDDGDKIRVAWQHYTPPYQERSAYRGPVIVPAERFEKLEEELLQTATERLANVQDDYRDLPSSFKNLIKESLKNKINSEIFAQKKEKKKEDDHEEAIRMDKERDKKKIEEAQRRKEYEQKEIEAKVAREQEFKKSVELLKAEAKNVEVAAHALANLWKEDGSWALSYGNGKQRYLKEFNEKGQEQYLVQQQLEQKRAELGKIRFFGAKKVQGEIDGLTHKNKELDNALVDLRKRYDEVRAKENDLRRELKVAMGKYQEQFTVVEQKNEHLHGWNQWRASPEKKQLDKWSVGQQFPFAQDNGKQHQPSFAIKNMEVFLNHYES